MRFFFHRGIDRLKREAYHTKIEQHLKQKINKKDP